MKRAIYFYSIVFGFFAGVIFDTVFRVSFSSFIAIALIAFSFSIFLVIRYKSGKVFVHELMIFALFLFAFACGGIRMESKFLSSARDPLLDFQGKNLSMTGIAEDDVGLTDTSVIINVSSIKLDNGIREFAPQRILIKYPNAELKYGDRVVFEGTISLPQNFNNSSGGEFDYVSYLAKDGIKHIVKFSKFIEKESGGLSLKSILYSIKRKFIQNIESVVPEPESALGAGVTIAGKGALPQDIKEDFIKAGIIHIVVLSGYNIAVVIGAILALFGFLGRKASAGIAMVAVCMFVIVSGGAAPVVRSAIMAGITLIGALSYTPVLQNRALFGAALFMVVWNPILLLNDASFALSFLATFAIVNLVVVVEPFIQFVSERFNIRKVLAETLSTQIFVLPYLLYQIGRLSIIAPISNIVILPLIPPIMILCFLVGIVGFIPFLALPLGGALFVLTYLVIMFAHLFASIPFASIDISISLFTMIMMYIAYFSFVYFWKNNASQALLATHPNKE